MALAAGLLHHHNAAVGAVIGLDGYEPSSYATGPIEDDSGVAVNGGTGFASQDVVDTLRSQVTVVSGGLAGTQSLQIAGAANSNDLVLRTFASQSGSPLYFSYLFRTTSGSGAATDDDFVQVGLTDVAGEPKNSIGFGATTATFFLRAGSGNGNQEVTAAMPAANTTYLMVGKLSKAGGSSTYNQMDLFLNPPGSVEPSPTLTRTAAAGVGAASVDRLSVRTARLDANDLYTLDNIRVGTTFADVVPEPASAGLLTLAACGLLASRRRARR